MIFLCDKWLLFAHTNPQLRLNTHDGGDVGRAHDAHVFDGVEGVHLAVQLQLLHHVGSAAVEAALLRPISAMRERTVRMSSLRNGL